MATAAKTTYEIRWIGTGTDKDGSGDCVLLRWGDLSDPAKTLVALIDAGRNKDDLKRLKAILTELAITRIDYLIGTHTDNDHIGQFPALMDDPNIEFGELWLLNPLDHLSAFPEHYEPPMAASASAPINSTLHQRVTNGDIRHINPRPNETESSDGRLIVAAPSQTYYEALLPRIFEYNDLIDLRDAKTAALLALNASAAVRDSRPFKADQLKPQWGSDRLGKGKGTPANNASIILLFKCPNGKQVLFTGDAGVEAFDAAEDDMSAAGFRPADLQTLQLPHHGSFHNVSPALLDRLLGTKIEDKDEADTAVRSRVRSCIAMNGINDTTHASGAVTDAAYQRGWTPYATDSKQIISNWYDPPSDLEPGSLQYVKWGANPK